MPHPSEPVPSEPVPSDPNNNNVNDISKSHLQTARTLANQFCKLYNVTPKHSGNNILTDPQDVMLTWFYNALENPSPQNDTRYHKTVRLLHMTQSNPDST
jgi:hypothetical protein